MGSIDWGAVLSLMLLCLLLGGIAYRLVSPTGSVGRRILVSAGISIGAIAGAFAVLALLFALGGTPAQR